MLDYYKLTDSKGRTHGGMQWGPGVTHAATGGGRKFCSPDLIHFYDDPLLAVLLNPVHGSFSNPRLWKGTAKGKVVSDKGLQYGAKTFTINEEMPVPVVNLEQRVKFTILCAKQACTEFSWTQWAKDYLSEKDRSAVAAGYGMVAEAVAAEGMAKAAWAAAWAAAEAQKTGQLNLKALAQEAMA